MTAPGGDDRRLVAIVILPLRKASGADLEYDPTSPKPSRRTGDRRNRSLAVDRQDHIYVAQRPSSLRGNERFTGAGDTPPKADAAFRPPILEFDAGTLIHSWGGRPGLTGRRSNTACSSISGQRVDCRQRRERRPSSKFTREGKFLRSLVSWAREAGARTRRTSASRRTRPSIRRRTRSMSPTVIATAA
jgi:hypothetical protein